MAFVHDVSSRLHSLFAGHVARPLPSLRGWRDTLALWIQRARSRRELARLDDRLLADLGLDRLEAQREARKPFWRA